MTEHVALASTAYDETPVARQESRDRISAFPDFARAVDMRFREMSAGELYVTGAEDLFVTYLGAFPEGTNPIFRSRTEHDCSCCRQFIRAAGNVVTLDGGKIGTVWDIDGLPHPYDAVAARMAEHVRSAFIRSVFRTKERKFGAPSTLELLPNTEPRRWHHFSCSVAGRHVAAAPDAARGEFDTNAQVLRRGLVELTTESIETVLDLINENAIYRGAEFKRALVEFRDLHAAYRRLRSTADKDVFVWSNVDNPAARFRNSVLGTLVQDLSAGVELDKAVRAFESKVAPQNYKRPTALITAKMADEAIAKLKELGLESAIERRFARLADVSVNNVLFVDNSVRGAMKDGIAGLLMDQVKPPKVELKNLESIAVEDFLARIVPQASSIDLLLANRHLSNFVSLTAPVHADAAQLFKWGNGFAWSYDGDAADSIKQRVKRAGGNVDADLRVSLGWFNTDDLDLHVIEPSGNHIYYGNKCGKLDVDMNVCDLVRDPVENISWVGRLRDGNYQVFVHSFTKRESIDVGFTVEVEFNGVVRHFTHARAVLSRAQIHALVLVVKGGMLTDIKVSDALASGSLSQEKWGIKTETLVPVQVLLASPNHWDGRDSGNKHWFFILKDCLNPEPARGIYNEFLLGALDAHRKVFEVLGAKSRCPPTDDQLSGVGFSSTRHDQATVVVKGHHINKAFNIIF